MAFLRHPLPAFRLCQAFSANEIPCARALQTDTVLLYGVLVRFWGSLRSCMHQGLLPQKARSGPQRLLIPIVPTFGCSSVVIELKVLCISA